MSGVTINGRPAQLPDDPEALLVDVLRDDLALTGTKLVCGAGVCGACTVLLDGMPVVSEHDMRLVPVVAVRQNVYPVKGKGLAVHGGKSAMALRIVPLPELVVNCLRTRYCPEFDPSWPVFASAGRDGTPTYRWPSNVRRNVRSARERVGLAWMTPHTWRRTSLRSLTMR